MNKPFGGRSVAPGAAAVGTAEGATFPFSPVDGKESARSGPVPGVPYHF